jgi:hypothetical protein
LTNKEKDEIVKCGCIFIECGIIRPNNVCTGARKHCCCFWYVILCTLDLVLRRNSFLCIIHVSLCWFNLSSAGSFPVHEDYISRPTLALFCIQCYPDCGCCLASPDCKVLDDLTGSTGPVPVTTMNR